MKLLQVLKLWKETIICKECGAHIEKAVGLFWHTSSRCSYQDGIKITRSDGNEEVNIRVDRALQDRLEKKYGDTRNHKT